VLYGCVLHSVPDEMSQRSAVRRRTEQETADRQTDRQRNRPDAASVGPITNSSRVDHQMTCRLLKQEVILAHKHTHRQIYTHRHRYVQDSHSTYTQRYKYRDNRCTTERLHS